MNDRVPTVVIMTGNGPVLINESDYDEEVHTLASDAKAPKDAGADSQGEAQTGSDGDAGQSDGGPAAGTPGALAAHAEAMIAAGTATDVKLVAKIGRNYFVVNDKGAKIAADGINAKGYGTEKEAWDAIMALAPSS